jgi:dienelactone hydrolase
MDPIDAVRTSLTGLTIAAFALGGLISPAAAVEWGSPTSEQAARCDKQSDLKDQNDCRWAYSVKGLKFPDNAEEPGFFTNTARMGIFKPSGSGPFPALILLHTCAAVDIDPRHMPYWVSQAVKAGYAAFVVDSWSQRGISELCQSSPTGFLSIHIAVRTRDAYDALEHLAKFDFIDKSRIAAIGFSNGGRVSYQLERKPVREMYSPSGVWFAAAIAVYGKCLLESRDFVYLDQDVDQPLLALLGELDRDGDPKVCVPLLEKLREKGAPVEWYVFPKTGHAWDQPKNSMPRTISYLGNPDGVLFAYDGHVTESTRDKVFEFLARHLGNPKK